MACIDIDFNEVYPTLLRSWYVRDTCLSTPNCSKIFNLSLRLSCNCSSAALLFVKSGDYTVVSCGSNIPFQSKVLFLLYLIDRCSNCMIMNFPAASDKNVKNCFT